MRERSVQCASAHGLHRMAYTEWGDPANPRVLVCVHGLTRNGRDFDFLAAALANDYRVVCPDVVGRGRSDWLKIKAGYGFPQYVADMVTLIARLDVPTVHWVGTSMGGLIGMILAALPGSPITRMVLNDVGPKITVESIHRIAEYVGAAPVFANLDVAERYIREVSAPFGPLTDAQWRHLTEHAVSAVDGGVAMVYDPGIAETFRESPLESDVDLWDVYDAIRCPTLVIRGADSDLLLHETALEMSQRGPKATLVEFEGIGHAPMLLDPAQIEVVSRFLLDDTRA
ncbi:alpha/beta fold hydrolase [Denitromonas sp.]|uniref:alpha/beta fold hydrolase n=1 Tax=Denitromonas sp. TaxID=2734609 RepID=UPI003A83C975